MLTKIRSKFALAVYVLFFFGCDPFNVEPESAIDPEVEQVKAWFEKETELRQKPSLTKTKLGLEIGDVEWSKAKKTKRNAVTLFEIPIHHNQGFSYGGDENPSNGMKKDIQTFQKTLLIYSSATQQKALIAHIVADEHPAKGKTISIFDRNPGFSGEIVFYSQDYEPQIGFLYENDVKTQVYTNFVIGTKKAPNASIASCGWVEKDWYMVYSDGTRKYLDSEIVFSCDVENGGAGWFTSYPWSYGFGDYGGGGDGSGTGAGLPEEGATTSTVEEGGLGEQDLLTELENLGYPIKLSEAKVLLFLPPDLRQFTIATLIQNREVALAKKAQLYGNNNDGTKGNAFQHILFSYLNSCYLGVDLARTLGLAHEDYEDNPQEHKAMDLHNNEIGFALNGYCGWDSQSVVQIIQGSILAENAQFIIE